MRLNLWHGHGLEVSPVTKVTKVFPGKGPDDKGEVTLLSEPTDMDILLGTVMFAVGKEVRSQVHIEPGMGYVDLSIKEGPAQIQCLGEWPSSDSALVVLLEEARVGSFRLNVLNGAALISPAGIEGLIVEPRLPQISLF